MLSSQADVTSDPVQVLVMEQFSINVEDRKGYHSFYLTFKCDENNNSGDKKHVFIGDSSRTVTQWTEVQGVPNKQL